MIWQRREVTLNIACFHYKDVTGYEIESVLLKQIHENNNIEILTHYFCLELITQHHLGQYVDKTYRRY